MSVKKGKSHVVHNNLQEGKEEMRQRGQMTLRSVIQERLKEKKGGEKDGYDFHLSPPS